MQGETEKLRALVESGHEAWHAFMIVRRFGQHHNHDLFHGIAVAGGLCA